MRINKFISDLLQEKLKVPKATWDGQDFWSCYSIAIAGSRIEFLSDTTIAYHDTFSSSSSFFLKFQLTNLSPGTTLNNFPEKFSSTLAGALG